MPHAGPSAHGSSGSPLEPLVREYPYIDPADVYSRFRATGSILLDSVRGPAHLARYSIIAVDPFLELRVKNGRVSVRKDGQEETREGFELDHLKALVDWGASITVRGLPFPGGAIGLISYDFVQYLETLPRTTSDDLDIPDLHLFFTASVITVDQVDRKVRVSFLPGFKEALLGPTASESPAQVALAELCQRLQPPSPSPVPIQQGGNATQIEHEMPAEQYRNMVRRVKEYIAAGDIFQANLSQRLKARLNNVDPWALYRVLRSINPSPFAAYLEMGEYQIASSSPERLVLANDGIVQTRPIAGTRPRGADAEGDRAMRAELLLNPKERAEHIMLIDLERNDLGRVSEFGSVEVDELMVTEDYSHVIHIVSNVRGRLRPGAGPVEIIRAVFPGGTITGVPKVRCMEIIDELEPVNRGPYTGSVGYIGVNGRMDFNIIIRTFVVKDGNAYVQAGAGIVADSDPEREYQETLKKAEALIRTIEHLQKNATQAASD